jgi:tRNA-specific 2-thiouridylase
MARVMAALSGGVDSAVAAALLVEAGHDVTGVHLKLADVPGAIAGQGCCTLDDAQDARRAAQVLDIPFYVWDMHEVFTREVEAPFAQAYARGVTPNPCITCNERVKYAGLLARARAAGFDALATGHHARLERDGEPVDEPGPHARLVRAVDRAKDQSYVLHVAGPEQLAATLLPVGAITKAQVRERAEGLGLRVAAKPDSHDVCFIPDGDTAGYLGARLGRTPGELRDIDGTLLGEHEGVWGFTVGQRRGLGLDHHRRRFVVDIDAARSVVTVGPREALACHAFAFDVASWTTGRAPEGRVRVQVRAHAATVVGSIVGTQGARVRVELEEPVLGLALGQSAVLYDLDDHVCLGGGPVMAAERPVAVTARP